MVAGDLGWDQGIFSVIGSVCAAGKVMGLDRDMLLLFAVLLGVGFGVRNPTMTAMRGAYFGRRAFAAITGMSMVPQKLLLLIAPLFAGFMRAATGTYDVSFLTIAAVSFSGSV